MLLVVLFVFNLNITKAEASGDISIFVNGMKQSYSQPPIIKNGRTLVPLRGIFETLGASVQWNPETKTIDAAKGNTSVWLKIGSTSTKVNGKTIIISTPAQIRNGRTLVPLRFISESLGDSVVWNNESKTAYIGESEFEEINNKEVFVGDNMQDIELPKEIKVYYSDNSFVSREVIWDTSNVEFNNPGNYNIMGSVEGIEETIEIKISVIKLEVESIEKIDYNSIKIGENYYGYRKEVGLGLQYDFLELHEATLNNKDKILFIPNKGSVRYRDYWGYSSSGAISKLVLVATDNYSIVPSENPYFDGSIKQLPYILKDIKEEYPNSKLDFRFEMVYDSISDSYKENFFSYDGNEYKVPIKLAEEVRGDNIFDNFYFKNQGIRHISTFMGSPYIAVNDLFNYFGINKTITYGNDGDNVYLEFK